MSLLLQWHGTCRDTSWLKGIAHGRMVPTALPALDHKLLTGMNWLRYER